MQKYLLPLILYLLSSTAMAAAGLNCADLEIIGEDDDALEVCITQTDNKLNTVYKKLRDTHKDNADMLTALKEMQLGWIKMRDAECLFQSLNSAGDGGVARSAIRCEIAMTIKRRRALEEM